MEEESQGWPKWSSLAVASPDSTYRINLIQPIESSFFLSEKRQHTSAN